MTGKCNLGEIRAQTMFCKMLLDRLNDDIKVAREGSWSGMADHCQKQDDIKRIRRELMKLSKMLNPWRECDE